MNTKLTKRRLTILALASTSVAGVGYAVGAFAAWDMNPATWSVGGRIALGLWFALVAFRFLKVISEEAKEAEIIDRINNSPTPSKWAERMAEMQKNNAERMKQS